MHQHHLVYGVTEARTHIGAIQTSAVMCSGGGIIQSNIGSLNLTLSNNNAAQHHNNPQILKIMCVKIENPYAGWALKTIGRLCVCAVDMNQ